MRGIETELMPLSAVVEEDGQLFIKWMTSEQRKKTDLDPNVLGYPRACMLRTEQFQETIAMVPVHPVFMLESLAQKPDLTDSQLVLALSSINDKVQDAMRDTGMAEAFLQTTIQRFADICERNGWEKNMYDPEKGVWLLKKRANIDWTKLLEKSNEASDKPIVEHADTEVAATPGV
jgi:hypothetical protein